MFRVLSEDESKKVTRWQAPELGIDDSLVVKTRQQARPQSTGAETSVVPLLGSSQLKPGLLKAQSTAPRLTEISSGNVVKNYLNVRHEDSASVTGLAGDASAVTAGLLQSSYDEGYAKGYSDANAALQQTVDEFKHLMEALDKACRHRDDSDLETEVIALTLDIARLIVQREISVDETLMHTIVTAGLEQLRGASDARPLVFLHPMDAEMVRKHCREESGPLIIDDPELDRGACRIESGSSTVNSGIEDWLTGVAVQLGLTSESGNMSSDTLSQEDHDQIHE